MTTIAPSVLAADFSRLETEIQSSTDAGARILHLDIMDGHFVPNISFGPAVVATIDRLTDAFLDVHLMLSQPERYLEPFITAGADNISFHLEVHPDPRPLAAQIRQRGVEVGIVINPDTTVESVLPFLSEMNYLLIMSVHPGFGGQKFMPDTLTKIERAREFISKEGIATRIEVDGGIDSSNARQVIDAGADILVMGTAFYSSTRRRELIRELEHYHPGSKVSIGGAH